MPLPASYTRELSVGNCKGIFHASSCNTRTIACIDNGATATNHIPHYQKKEWSAIFLWSNPFHPFHHIFGSTYVFLRFTSSKRSIFIMNWNWHEWGKTRLKSIQNSFFLAQWIIFYHHHLHWFRCSSPAVLFRNHSSYRSNMNTFDETLYFLELAWNSFCSIQIYTYL